MSKILEKIRKNVSFPDIGKMFLIMPSLFKVMALLENVEIMKK